MVSLRFYQIILESICNKNGNKISLRNNAAFFILNKIWNTKTHSLIEFIFYDIFWKILKRPFQSVFEPSMFKNTQPAARWSLFFTWLAETITLILLMINHKPTQLTKTKRNTICLPGKDINFQICSWMRSRGWNLKNESFSRLSVIYFQQICLIRRRDSKMPVWRLIFIYNQHFLPYGLRNKWLSAVLTCELLSWNKFSGVTVSEWVVSQKFAVSKIPVEVLNPPFSPPCKIILFIV